VEVIEYRVVKRARLLISDL